MNLKTVLLTFLAISLVRSVLHSGPPFATDDPQPVDYRHWELYIASGQSFTKDETDATLPHIEINYGIVPEVQLHIILPMEYVHSNSVSRYGFSKTELGIKYRFIDESGSKPQVGTFPILLLPTGGNSNNVEVNSMQAFFPLWLQKSWSKLTSYGGGGYWLDTGKDKKNHLFFGCEVQYDLSSILTLGSEIFYQTADEINSPTILSFNIGGSVNLSYENHLLFSFGHSLNGDNTFMGYIAYQLTI